MRQIPHTITAPQSRRPNPGQVLKQAIVREDTRKQQRREWWRAVAVHALYFVLVVLGTIALMID